MKSGLNSEPGQRTISGFDGAALHHFIQAIVENIKGHLHRNRELRDHVYYLLPTEDHPFKKYFIGMSFNPF